MVLRTCITWLLRSLPLLALAAVLGCSSEPTVLHAKDAELGDGSRVRALLLGEEIIYAFVADPALTVMWVPKVPATIPPGGVLFCTEVEDGLYCNGEQLTPPADGKAFALFADGQTESIALSGGELSELSRALRFDGGELKDAQLSAKLRAPLSRDGG